MAEIDGINGNGNHGGVVFDIKDNYPSSSSIKEVSVLNFSVPFMQKGCKIYLLFCAAVPVFSPCHMQNPNDRIRFLGFFSKKPDLTEPDQFGLNRFSVRFG